MRQISYRAGSSRGRDHNKCAGTLLQYVVRVKELNGDTLHTEGDGLLVASSTGTPDWVHRKPGVPIASLISRAKFFRVMIYSSVKSYRRFGHIT